MALPWRAPHQPVQATRFRPGTDLPSNRPELAAQLHPLVRHYVAYRQGRVDGHAHSTEEAADQFGIDPAFASAIDEYLAARHRLQVQRAGWRASLLRLS